MPPEVAPSPDRPWVAVAANPYSGSRENRSLVAGLVAALSRRGLGVREIWDTAELDKLRDNPSFASHCACVVAAGGDGTINRVINHLVSAEVGTRNAERGTAADVSVPRSAIRVPTSPVPLAVLPLGTENLFAAHFNFTHDVERLADAIVRGQTRTIDLARVNDQIFSVVASAGFDAAVAHRLANWRTLAPGSKTGGTLRRVKRHTYLRPIFATACGYRYPMMEIDADGRRLRGALVMVFNLPRYGFGFELAPHAIDDDGQLDWLVFERPGRFRLALYALALRFKRHLGRHDLQHGRARRITLRPVAEDVPVEMDGEAAGFTPCEIAALPGALRVIVV
jgi:diacylglycerol kinase family enzyme